jgi:hypothetical protein
MATNHLFHPIGVKAPASIEEFYKRYLKGRMFELKTVDIPLPLLVEVNQFQRKYKMIKINVRKEDVEVINKVSEIYGVSKGTALLMIVFYNFS